MRIKLPHYAVREVRVAVCSAKLAMHLFRCAVERGDMNSARQYRIEARDYLAKARFRAECSLTTEDVDFQRLHVATRVFPKLPADQHKQALQDESISEQVSAEPASPRLSLRSVLVGKAAPGAIQQSRRVRVQIVNFDGVFPNRLEFPRLGKHWAPPSVLVGNQERKGHPVLRP